MLQTLLHKKLDLGLKNSTQFFIRYNYPYNRAYPPPKHPLTTVSFTFLGEKLSAVLPGSDHFAWDLPKELHDQSDVVCPPPHTSQREQARFSITACTHTSTRLAVWGWHTRLSWGTAWTHSQMDCYWNTFKWWGFCKIALTVFSHNFN